MSSDLPDTSTPPERPARSPKRYALVMKLVRRTHMYLGLLLFPWLLVFGISGMLFNHPNLGEDVKVRELSSEQLRSLTGLEPVQAGEIAREVVARLNAQNNGQGGAYQLDPGFESSFSGFTVLLAPGEGENHIFIVDLKDGTATLSTRNTGASKPQETAPFAGATVSLPNHSMAAIESKVAQLLPKLDVQAKTPLRASPRGAPEVRFRMTDAQQRAWNVTYNLGSGRLDGRPTEATPEISANELLTKLHKTHHYPLDVGFTWVWALFADITGLMIVFWAVSGLFMWWQMKPTRVIGVGAISLAVGLGLFFIGGTIAELHFGNVQKRTGPGDGQPPPAQAKPAAAAARPVGAVPAPEVMTRSESDDH
ncbi:hypothetical protein F0U60_22070 [Archangium minus]|uniref:PepSY-associated TM helix domain protein n=1 Tax=Archangium minus TaxID=83450 RepID=A0ABY9WUY9_9BACT|nr:hypothetical protein F0U60_22070 [Archangium minus]